MPLLCLPGKGILAVRRVQGRSYRRLGVFVFEQMFAYSRSRSSVTHCSTAGRTFDHIACGSVHVPEHGSMVLLSQQENSLEHKERPDGTTYKRPRIEEIL